MCKARFVQQSLVAVAFDGNFVGLLLLMLQQHGFNLCHGSLLLHFAFDRLPPTWPPVGSAAFSLMHIICGSLRFAIMRYIRVRCMCDVSVFCSS